MRLRALSVTIVGVDGLVPLPDCVVGVQSRSLSLARQWGRFGDGSGRRSGGYGRGLGAVFDVPAISAGEGSGELNHAGLDSIVLEDAEDQLVLELGLCSGSLSCLLPSAPRVEDSGGTGGVSSLPDVPEFSS